MPKTKRAMIGHNKAVTIVFLSHCFPPKFLYIKVLVYPDITLKTKKQMNIVSIILILISGFIKPIKYNINETIIKQNISNPVPIKALKVFWCIGGLNTSEAICFQPYSSKITLSLMVIF